MKNKIKVAIVGCGRIFFKHQESIKILKTKYDLIGVFDLNKKKNVKACKLANCQYFDDLDDLIKNNKPDLVTILTESGKHIDVCKKIYNKYKITKFIIEKPIDILVNKINKFKKFIIKNKIYIYTVKQNRFNKAVVKTKQLIDSNKIGKIFMISASCKWRREQAYYNQDYWRGTRKYDGGVLMNQAIHHIDLLIYLCGDVDSVIGYGATRFVKIESENIAVASIKFKNNALGVLEATTATSPNDYEGSITIMGSKGTLKISGFASNKISYFENVNNEKIDFSKYEDDIKNIYGKGHLKFYEYVYKSITQNKKNIFSIDSSIKSVEVVEKIVKSFKTKRIEKI